MQGKKRKEGKGSLPEWKKRLAPAHKAYMSRKFLQITTGQIRKKQRTKPPQTNHRTPQKKKKTEKNA